MTDTATPQLHRINDDAIEAGAEPGSLIATVHEVPAASDATGPAQLHIAVEVGVGTTTAHAVLASGDERLHGIERWMRYQPRGASPAGWTAGHEFAHDARVMRWKVAAADAIDKVLIQRSKEAFRLDGTPTYVVTFAPIDAPVAPAS